MPVQLLTYASLVTYLLYQFSYLLIVPVQLLTYCTSLVTYLLMPVQLLTYCASSVTYLLMPVQLLTYCAGAACRPVSASVKLSGSTGHKNDSSK